MSNAYALLDRHLLLRSAEERARSWTDAERSAVRGLANGARARLDAALGERGVAALVLAREAILLALEAIMTLEAGKPADRTPEALWRAYDELVMAGRVKDVPAWVATSRIRTMQSRSADEEIAEAGEPLADEAIRVASGLLDLVEVRSPRRIRVERVLRATFAMALVALIITELVVHFPSMTNLAQNAQVTPSTRRPTGGQPGDLVNGRVENGSAFATREEADAWIRIDLPMEQRVSQVTLYNQEEHEDDALPIRIETSVDGTTWTPGATVEAHFTKDSPAVASFPARQAKSVRLHARPGAALGLNEVEVR